MSAAAEKLSAVNTLTIFRAKKNSFNTNFKNFLIFLKISRPVNNFLIARRIKLALILQFKKS